MREISLHDVEKRDQLPVDTYMLYGDTGAGKTTWSAGMPRPLFLADESEGGWASLKGLADDQLFEAGVTPLVWGINAMNDMDTSLGRIPALVASGRVRTVVISSITFYADTYLAHLVRNNPSVDTRQLYGSLATHLRDLRTRFHSLGVNVMWEALAAHPEAGEDGRKGKPGRPAIAGKSGDQFAAGVGYLFRCVMEEVREGGKVVSSRSKVITKTEGGYIARSRIGVAAKQPPNPITTGYKGFLQALGYDIEQLRRGLPRLPTVAATPAKVTAPAPIIKPTTPKAPTPAAATKPATSTNK